MDDLPWVEKQRPVKIADIQYHDYIKQIFRNIADNYNMPHLLLYGPPGTGKTSSILALMKEMYGKNYRDFVKEFNASDDRSISIVREKIKSFCESMPKKGINPENNKPFPSFNVIILDEADAMTQDAQFALRRMMEVQSNTCRFVIICNQVQKIIDALNSRCAKFWFKGLSDDSQIERLELICTQEGIGYDRNALRYLLSFTEGDLRRSINMLQSCVAVYDSVSMQNLDVVFGKVEEGVVDKVIEAIMKKDKTAAIKCSYSILSEGWALDILLLQLADKILASQQIKEDSKALMIKTISDAESQLTDGGSEELNLSSCFATLSTISV